MDSVFYVVLFGLVSLVFFPPKEKYEICIVFKFRTLCKAVIRPYQSEGRPNFACAI